MRSGARLGGPQPARRAAQVPVEQWRAALWARALAEQGAADAPAGGAALQARFRAARLRHFRLEPGARVRCRAGASCPRGVSVGRTPAPLPPGACCAGAPRAGAPCCGA